MFENYKYYIQLMNSSLQNINYEVVDNLKTKLINCYSNSKNVFICGNGGSADNANHITNDFVYGVRQKIGDGLKFYSLCANESVTTCLANDVGYENIFSHQINLYGEKNDLLIVLSGSGNSLNVINAITNANNKKINTFGIIGYDGGRCIKILKETIHIPVNDMQICEDIQLVIMHMVMKDLQKELKI